MRIKLPEALTIDDKVNGNPIRQLLATKTELDGALAKYTGDGVAGYVFTATAPDSVPIHILTRRPSSPARLATFRRALLHTVPLVEPYPTHVDLGGSKWLRYVDGTASDATAGAAAPAKAALASWKGKFRYVEEDADNGVVALRPPQIGALHAVHAHWSVSRDVATIVMPTGTGKTETMLAILVSVPCERVLVVVPTDALRSQLASKFETLGVLKARGSAALSAGADHPVVCTLMHTPTTVEDVDVLFARSNVVVTTSHVAARCDEAIRERIAELCPFLFIDEAHHAEAPTWREFKEAFRSKRILQFTATPFREDERQIDGRIIYRYPLRKAQEEHYFRPIKFASVVEFDARKSDEAIAVRAIEELRADTTGKHIVMARVDRIGRASQVFPLYERHPEFNPIVLHTGISSREREKYKQQLFSGNSRIVVCVDMLGEGFDLPELKIAAFHDIRKSLAVTLQLAGRFTRSRADLGNATFIANVAAVDVREELQKLYSRDPDWNALLPPLSDAAIDEQVATQEFLDGFSWFPPEFPLKEIRPAASTVIYRTFCDAWMPEKFRDGLYAADSYDAIHHSINEVKKMLVLVCGRSTPTEWAELEDVRDWSWELFVVVWDEHQHLLFIHGSSNSGEFRSLAEAVAGADVQLIRDPDLFRCFFGMGRLMLNNVGLTEQLGRLVRFTGRMGADVGTALSDAQRRNTRKAVLFGSGYEAGEKTTVGASKKGRVWSFQRLRLDSFASWCKHVGRKVVNTDINPDDVLKGTLEPKLVSVRPRLMPICIDWPEAVYQEFESAYSVVFGRERHSLFHNISIDLVDPTEDGELLFAIRSDEDVSTYRLELFQPTEGQHDYRVVHVRGPAVEVRLRQRGLAAEQFLDFNPPFIWFVDGSYLEGNQHVSLRTGYEPFDRGKIEPWDWTGINLRKESQGVTRAADSVQRRVIDVVSRQEGLSLVYDDDGSGESADVVTVRQVEREGRVELDVNFYHCKYTRGRPGARVDDLFAVCGQAQKSICWLHDGNKRVDLFLHLLKREPKRKGVSEATRYEVGDQNTLMALREVSKVARLNLAVFVVQPGLSKVGATRAQLDLLAATENYLRETFGVPFGVIASP